MNEQSNAMGKTVVEFEAGLHKAQRIIKIKFGYDKALVERVKQLRGAKWSKSMQCWYVPDTEAYRLRFKLEPRIATPHLLSNISPENKLSLDLFMQELQLKSYSPNTMRTYRNEFGQLLQTLKSVPVNTLTQERLKNYFAWCHKELQLTENTIHSRLNAVKFYFEQVLKGEKFFWEIPRPKKRTILPKVISEQKLLKGLLNIENLKHKSLLFTAYSAGLRVSEVVKLKVTDIDSDRMQIRIENGKGKKDRMATLAKSTLQILREYVKQYRPKIFLFEGQFANEHYHTRSAQMVFAHTFKQLGLPANISFHSLRHSYATHLLENGTDIVYIQELLGHGDIKTTLRYTHVSTKQIGKIESPLDKIMRNN